MSSDAGPPGPDNQNEEFRRLALEQRQLEELIAANPHRADLTLRLCNLLVAQNKPLPAELEQRALTQLLETDPTRLEWLLRLCDVLTACGEAIPLELEERALSAVLIAHPERVDLVLRLCAVLLEQGKPVPPELEERWLWGAIETEPTRADLTLRLCSLLTTQGKAVPPDLEEQSLVNCLAVTPARADLALSLADLLHRRGRRLSSVADAGWCLTTDPYTQGLEPFVFLHIPKTAGSAVRNALLSLFDQAHIFPGSNYPEFDSVKGDFATNLDPARHSVFVGHMYWDAISTIETSLQRRPNVFVVFREPSSHYRSQIAFIDRLLENGERSAIVNGKRFSFDFWTEDKRMLFGVTLMDLQVVALLDDYGKIYDVDGTFDPKFMNAPDPRELRAASELMLQRLARVHIGLFEELRASLDLLCARLGLPYLAVPTKKENASGADHALALGTEQLAALARRQSLCFELDAHARERFHADYVDAFAGVSNVREHLNEAYRRALQPCLQPCWFIDLVASNAWPGYGWGIREDADMPVPFRQLPAGEPARIMARLFAGCDYFVVLKVCRSDDEKTLHAVSASAGGALLKSLEGRFADGQFVLNWLMPETCLQQDGYVEICFSLQAGGDERLLAVSGIEVFPATLSSAI